MTMYKLELGKPVPTAIIKELSNHEYSTWATPGNILYKSEDGEEYATVPINARVLVQTHLPEGSRKRKRVLATIEELLLNNQAVNELVTHDSQPTIIEKGQKVYVPPQWFNTAKPKQPKASQSAMKL